MCLLFLPVAISIPVCWKEHYGQSPILCSVSSDQLETIRESYVRASVLIQQDLLGRCHVGRGRVGGQAGKHTKRETLVVATGCQWG